MKNIAIKAVGKPTKDKCDRLIHLKSKNFCMKSKHTHLKSSKRNRKIVYWQIPQLTNRYGSFTMCLVIF